MIRSVIQTIKSGYGFAGSISAKLCKKVAHRSRMIRSAVLAEVLTITALILTFGAGSSLASTSGDVKEGNLLYNNKRYDEAIKVYDGVLDKKPDDAMLRFNKGNALYKKGSYNSAIESYNKAIAQGRVSILADSDYNIGNANYRIGSELVNSDINQAKELYEAALQFYKRAIDLNPDDRDAKFNYEFVDQKLMSLKEKKEDQKKKDKDQEQDKEDKKDQDKDNKKDQNKQDQAGQGSQDNKDQNNQGQKDKQEQDQKEQQNKEQDQKEQKQEQRGQGQGQDQEKQQSDQKKEGEGKSEQDQQQEEQKKQEEQQKQEEQKRQEEQKKREEQQKQEEQQRREEQKKREEQQKQEEQKKREEQQKQEEQQRREEQKKQEEGQALQFYEQGGPEQREMTEAEANMLLEGYRGEEATGQSIRMRRKQVPLPEPEKDW